MIKRISDKFRREPRMNVSPCSRQGLPFYNVTAVNCRLLPYSFHPYPIVIKTTEV